MGRLEAFVLTFHQVVHCRVDIKSWMFFAQSELFGDCFELMRTFVDFILEVGEWSWLITLLGQILGLFRIESESSSEGFSILNLKFMIFSRERFKKLENTFGSYQSGSSSRKRAL